LKKENSGYASSTTSGNCKGPCEAHQSEEDYDRNISQIKNLLKGNLNPVIQHFKSEMKEHAVNLEFEKAELTRKKISYLENYQSRSIVINTSLGDVDAFAIQQDTGEAYVNYLMVQNGTIIQTKTIRVETHLDESLKKRWHLPSGSCVPHLTAKPVK
jgi:excinuclease ABC subunit C